MSTRHRTGGPGPIDWRTASLNYGCGAFGSAFGVMILTALGVSALPAAFLAAAGVTLLIIALTYSLQRRMIRGRL